MEEEGLRVEDLGWEPPAILCKRVKLGVLIGHQAFKKQFAIHLALSTFRLPRNLQAFFSQFVGLIVSAMCAAAQAVVSPKVSLRKSIYLVSELL